jgi:hypothetical protein
MTVSVAWVRSLNHGEELWFASDSRLTGGRSWDYCPKIVTFSRLDSAISLAGETDTVYPLMLQCALAIDYYGPARGRATDVPELKTHVLKVFNNMVEAAQETLTVSIREQVPFRAGAMSRLGGRAAPVGRQPSRPVRR